MPQPTHLFRSLQGLIERALGIDPAVLPHADVVGTVQHRPSGATPLSSPCPSPEASRETWTPFPLPPDAGLQRRTTRSAWVLCTGAACLPDSGNAGAGDHPRPPWVPRDLTALVAARAALRTENGRGLHANPRPSRLPRIAYEAHQAQQNGRGLEEERSRPLTDARSGLPWADSSLRRRGAIGVEADGSAIHRACLLFWHSPHVKRGYGNLSS